jgi:general secretion pathway protein G
MNPKPVEVVVLDYASVQRSPRRVPCADLSVLAACVAGAGFIVMLTVPALTGGGGGERIDMARAVIGPNGPLSQAIEWYKADVGHYPGALAGLLTEPSSLRGSGRWGGPYIKSADGLLDPWGNPYQYCAPGIRNQTGFDLWSLGPDGVARTADDILGGGP